MFWLVTASLLWAFSFGLIKRFLVDLDPWWVATWRLVLAALAFSPWLVRRCPTRPVLGRALLLGALQFGVMYTCYLASFRYLAAWQVALWTVMTPVFVVAIDQGLRRAPGWRAAAAAGLAVVGAMVAQGRLPTGDTLTGVLFVQASNLAFAVGQLGYRRLVAAAAGPDDLTARPGREVGLLGWMYVGAAAFTLLGALVLRRPFDGSALASAAPAVAYLGLVPTAVGFWLWNRGAARVDAGRLGVANNLKVPLAVLTAWLVFGEQAAYGRALVGLVVIVAALVWVDRAQKPEGPER